MKLLSAIKKVYRRIALWIGTFVLVLVVLGFVGKSFFAPRHEAQKIPDQAFLFLNVDQDVRLFAPRDVLSLLRGESILSLDQVVLSLSRAARDDRVRGLIVTVGSGSNLGIAGLQELRGAIAEMRTAGKTTVAYNTTFGLETDGLRAYYLASAFEKVYMQPSGVWHAPGLGVETIFWKGGLDRLGITPQFFQREEYKGAMETFQRTEFSPPTRQNLSALLAREFDLMVGDMAASRPQMTADALRLLSAGSPLTAAEATAAGVIDKTMYWADLLDQMEKEQGKDATPIAVGDYAALLAESQRNERVYKDGHFALINARGPILYAQRGERLGMMQDDVIDAYALSDLIHDLAHQKDIKAIILRLDSPGGSYTASDTIHAALQYARAKGKPVVVNMVNTAASGGYFIALAGDKIIAQPTTITGSIGVVFGKFVGEDLVKKLGLSVDRIATGDNVDFFSPFVPFRDDQIARVNAVMDGIYTDFITHVAAARHLSVEDVRARAKGQVWTGAQAKELGLIDDFGGIQNAITTAKTLIHLDPAQPVRVVTYPKMEHPFEHLMNEVLRQYGLVQGVGMLLSGMQNTLWGHLSTALSFSRSPVQAIAPFQVE